MRDYSVDAFQAKASLRRERKDRMKEKTIDPKMPIGKALNVPRGEITLSRVENNED